MNSPSFMEHRHLNHEDYTLAAIDDAIDRGSRRDWDDLRRASLAEPLILEKILRVCAPRVADPYAQRYHLWRRYAEQHLA